MEWKDFTEVAEKVKELTTKLEEETGKIGQICEQYRALLREELATPDECKDLDKLTECLKEVQNELENVQEKEASGKILIKFVGATSSGKSSLINTLLRSRRLPVGFMQTTMCSIKVCITKEEEWSVTVRGGKDETVCLSKTKDEKAIKDLLSQMSGRKHSKDRQYLGIGTRSIVQVNWPEHLCEVLPLDVVLFDTPGFGENVESDEVVTESCREADIIVAVMDAMSPSKATVAKLVNDVNCQFTFGVFTKWDECIRKAQEESEDTVDVDQVREDTEQDFQKALKGQCKVFFVDVKCENNNDAGFKKFESTLAASATKLKGESLINQAKSVDEKSTEMAETFKAIIGAKKKGKLDRLTEEMTCIGENRATFNEMLEKLKKTEIVEDIFSEKAKEELLQKFEEDLVNGKSETEAVNQFLSNVNKKIKDTMSSKRKGVKDAFEHWSETVQSNCYLNVNNMVSDEYPRFENQALTTDQYKWYFDPHYYYTHNKICGGVAVGALAATAAFTFAGPVAWVGWMAVETLPWFVGGGAVVGATAGGPGEAYVCPGLGDKINNKFPISGYKVNCWKKTLRSELEKFHEHCRNLISQDLEEIHKKFSAKLESARDWTLKEIQGLNDASHNLTKWAKEIDESRRGLQETGKKIDALLTELRRKMEERADELRRQYEENMMILSY